MESETNGTTDAHRSTRIKERENRRKREKIRNTPTDSERLAIYLSVIVFSLSVFICVHLWFHEFIRRNGRSGCRALRRRRRSGKEDILKRRHSRSLGRCGPRGVPATRVFLLCDT